MKQASAYNFSPGPAALPPTVLDEAAEELRRGWKGDGIRVMEMSHRGTQFIQILKNTEARLRALLSIPETYSVQLLQGGATGQFAAIPMNLLGAHDSADYLVTGQWSEKAAQEAGKYCKVNVVGSGKPGGFKTLPDNPLGYVPSEQSAYFHFCENETVHGLEYPTDYLFDPKHNNTGFNKPVVVDMSSNFLSRPFDITNYSVVYAGAQKNAGIAGLTFVIVKKDLFEIPKAPYTPSVFDWTQMHNTESCLNTPPTYAIYMASLCLDWIASKGGLSGIAHTNDHKARLLYDCIDNSKGFYSGIVQEPRWRSRMNVVYRVNGADEEPSPDGNKQLEDAFVKEAEARGLLNLKGYRTLGGIRASLYNAVSTEAVEALVDFMNDFQRKHEK